MKNLPDYDYQVVKLNEDFYRDYPNADYPEIAIKEDRRYNCLLIQTHYDYFICVPFRSNVKHKSAFHFKSSQRSKRSKSALDYSKIVIIKDTKCLDNKQGIVDADEYREMMINLDRIVSEALKYVDDYVAFLKCEKDKIDKRRGVIIS